MPHKPSVVTFDVETSSHGMKNTLSFFCTLCIIRMLSIAYWVRSIPEPHRSAYSTRDPAPLSWSVVQTYPEWRLTSIAQGSRNGLGDKTITSRFLLEEYMQNVVQARKQRELFGTTNLKRERELPLWTEQLLHVSSIGIHNCQQSMIHARYRR